MKLVLCASTFAPVVIPEHILELHWKLLEAKAKHCREPCFNGPLYRLEKIDGDRIFVSEGIDYKTITALRNPIVPICADTNVISVLAIPITTDGKIVLGKAKYFGDWANERYELGGGFITNIEFPIEIFATMKIKSDWGLDADLSYLMPVYTGIALETSFVFVAKLPISSKELSKSNYDEFIVLENMRKTFDDITDRQHEFHQTSFQVLRNYLYNLDK